nr:protein phosphatase 1 regulatory inhibitor [Hymenolepis microstoma]
MRLKEVWDKREDLRSAVKKTALSTNNNGNSNFVRGFGSSRRKSKCGCGELELHHYNENDTVFAEVWSPNLISNLGPTNAYGVLDFHRGVKFLNKSAEYVRISDDDSPRNVITLMDKYWQIFDAYVPELCISVLGDFDSKQLDGKQIASFEKGLMTTMQATKTVSVTHGLNAGIAPTVAKAASMVHARYMRPHCIGVSPWGYVRSHYNLVRSEHCGVKSHVEYGTSDIVNPKEPISLNEDHTNFVLVDNGMRNRFNLSDVTKFRDEIENIMAISSKEGGCGIPVVTVVYGGGFDVVESVSKRAVNGMPIIICASTGRAADIFQLILQYKMQNPRLEGFSEVQTTELERSLRKLIMECVDDKMPNWTVEYGIKLLKNAKNSAVNFKCVNLNGEYGYYNLDKAITENLMDLTVDKISEVVGDGSEIECVELTALSVSTLSSESTVGPDLGRIERAKEERRKQLLKWDEYDRSYQNNFHHKARKKGSAGVRFENNLVFLEAASRGDLLEVQKLIDSGIDPDVANEDGLTALHQCCIDNNLDMCILLLEKHANVNAKDNEQWTPLHAAATCGNKELCGILIDCGDHSVVVNVSLGSMLTLSYLKNKLCPLSSLYSFLDVTQSQIDEIRLGPEREMLTDLKRRYAAGDDLQSLDAQGAAPLEVIETLVAYGADLNATTKNGQTVYGKSII